MSDDQRVALTGVALFAAERDAGGAEFGGSPAPAGSGEIDRLAEAARGYARQAAAENTLRAYAKDWAHYAAWCARHGVPPLPPAPQTIGLYLADLARPRDGGTGLRVSSIERRLAGIGWTCRQRGHALDRRDAHVASVLAGIRRRHGAPPAQKFALSADDIRAMCATLGRDLRGLRDRALLLLGFASGLRRAELTGLDLGENQTEDGRGWLQVYDEGFVVVYRGKTGWREAEVGCGAFQRSCPVVAMRDWLAFARIADGPVFRRVSSGGDRLLEQRLGAASVARIVKTAAMAAGVRADLPEAERRALFAGHSLRAGLATHAEVDERHVQRQLGHASAATTRRYQRRRERFRVNLTLAAGL